MQRNGIFPGRYAPLTYYEEVLEASRNTLMARNAREICNTELCRRFILLRYFDPVVAMSLGPRDKELCCDNCKAIPSVKMQPLYNAPLHLHTMNTSI